MKLASVTEKKDAYENALEHIIRDLPESIQWSNDGHWICFKPEELTLPAQGWKIHLSVIPVEGAELLHRITPILTTYGVMWKAVSSGLKLIETSNGSTPLPQTGKCVTIYARSDEQFMQLLEELNDCTKDLKGPSIPTDRAYQGSSCVFYRYGAFVDRFYYDRYSCAKVYAIQNPGGGLEEDRRTPGRYKPEWVEEPEELVRIQTQWKNENEATCNPSSSSNNEFGIRKIRVKRVLKKSGKGGVFLVSTSQNEQAVMKEAVHLMRVDGAGRSAHDYLNNEYHVLDLMKDTGYTPRPIDLFSFQQNRYLMLEYFESISLREYIHRRHVAADYNQAEFYRVSSEILDIVQQFHDKGIVINDLTPNNIVVLTDDGSVRLIDLELAYVKDSSSQAKPLTGHTPGYVLRGREHSQRSEYADDLYALGAVYYYMASSMDPYLKYRQSHLSAGKAYLDNLTHTQLRGLGSLGIEIMSGQYNELSEIRKQLARLYEQEKVDVSRSEPVPVSCINETDMTAEVVLHQAELMANKLHDSLDFSNPHQLYPENSMSKMFHPANFNFGWTGMAYGFHQLGEITQNRKYHQYAREVLEWLLSHTPYVPEETPESLYFGYGAVPWALALTAKALDDEPLLRIAEDLAVEMTRHDPVQTNISHGAAGLGLMLLEVHRHGGCAELLTRADELGGFILEQEKRTEDGLSMWEVKEKTDKKGHESFGFSHGIAGIGYFLLALADVTGRDEYYSAVRRIVHTLERTSYEGLHGVRLWPASPEKPDALWVHWCNGSAGIGRFLLTAAETLQDPVCYRLGQQAADAVAQSTIFASFGQCHGIAGNGDFLLMADRSFPGRYEAKLKEYTRSLHVLRSDRQEDLWMWPLEDMESFSPDYMTGYMGIYAFLLRRFYPAVSFEPVVYSGFDQNREVQVYDANIHS
ncbi:lanthionine synthetase LanC family protein [Paenibacillus tundrae]|uniref:Serine/threonine protein kinase n=1 Tax=Paenibacillus tundrae TaxID=528187 RepID=A0ABT9WGI4_9BACL|nr:lanthionine synthetase LanC family protein [Paenibacillus tundrae]MDQ0172332.1 serine/threonine protein kinase [Paenibacillus tundrae]